MLIIFLLIVATGLAAFLYIYLNAVKNGAAFEPAVAVGGDSHSPDVVEIKVACEVLTQKVAKLEQLIDEKNALILNLQNKSGDGTNHAHQVDALKQILQTQIEEQKIQNKKLKDDMARVIDENTSLQARVFAADVRKAPEHELLDVKPSLSSNSPDKAVSKKTWLEEADADTSLAPASGEVQLHDVFSDENQAK